MKRKNELSFLNIIFCILVIFIHVSSSPVTNLTKGTWQYGAFFVPWRLSAFVVQGFIFLSGLKMFLVGKTENYFRFCWSKFTKIVIPYIFAVCIFYAYFIDREYFPFRINDLLEYVKTGNLVAHFYFVIIIIQFYLLKPVWQFMVNKIPPAVAIIASVPLMFFFIDYFSDYIYNDRIVTSYLPYWVIGCYVGANFEKFTKHIKRYRLAYIFQYFVIAIAEAAMTYKQFVVGGISFLDELHFVYCISAILFTYSLATMIGERVMKWKLSQKIDKASYYIYLIHPLFIFIIDEKLFKREMFDIGENFIIRSIVTYVVSIAVSILYVEMKGFVKGNILCRNSEKQK